MNAPGQLLIPPHSMEAEQAVIGALMLEPERYWQVELTAEDFYRRDHRLIFRTIGQLLAEEKAADVVTVSEVLGEQAGGLAYLASITRDTPTAANARAYADLVRDLSRKRMALRYVGEALDSLRELSGVAEVVADLQAKLESLTTSRGYLDMGGVLTEAQAAIAAARERRAKGVSGFVFGLPSLDYATGGITGPKLVVLAARPSLGKTALVHQAAMIAAKAGQPVGKVELEMSAAEIGTRSMAYAYGVNVTDLAHGENGALEAVKQRAVAHNIRTYPLYTDETAFTVPEITSRITEWHRRFGIHYASVDHLQLVHTNGDNRAQELGKVTRSLKLLAKRLDIPVILLCQFNRALAKDDRKPQLIDLRDSGEIEQDADIVLALHGPLDADEDGCRTVEIGLLKHRGGRTGWLPQQFRFRGRFQRFEELTDGPIQRSSDSETTRSPGDFHARQALRAAPAGRRPYTED